MGMRGVARVVKNQRGCRDGARKGDRGLFIVCFRILLLPRRAAACETLDDVIIRQIVRVGPVVRGGPGDRRLPNVTSR
jgi:hypothetical protein